MHVCSDIRLALFTVDFRVTFITTGSVSSSTLTQNLVSAPDSRTAGTATRYCLQTQRCTHSSDLYGCEKEKNLNSCAPVINFTGHKKRIDHKGKLTVQVLLDPNVPS